MNILLVDDEYLLLEGLKQKIDGYGLPVRITHLASNAEEALEFLQHNKADLVITDIRMPKMSGLELAERIKTLDAGLPVILLSGYSDFEYARTALRISVDEYLTKPVDDKSLGTCLEKFLASYRLKLMERNKQMLLRYLNAKENAIRPENLSPFVGVPASETFDLYLIHSFDPHIDPQSDRSLLFSVDCGIPGYTYGLLRQPTCNEETGQLKQRLSYHLLVACENVPWRELPKQFAGMMRCLRDHASPWQWKRIENSELTLQSAEKLTQQLVAKWKGLLSHAKISAALESWEKWKLAWLDCPPSWVEFHQLLELLQSDIAGNGERLAFVTAQAELKPWPPLLHSVTEIVRDVLEHNCRQTNSTLLLVQSAETMIREYWDEVNSLDELARRLYVSSSHLGKSFKKLKGCSVSEYITKFRMEKAVALLSLGTLKTIDVAVEVGYGDYRYFSKLFKKHTGSLPSKFNKA